MKIFNTMFQKIFLFSLLLGITASCSKTDSNPDFSAIDKQVIEEYLTVKKLTAQSTPSGLYYIITTPGGAVHPTINDSVTAYYRGYLANGNIFDQSTYTNKKPATFLLSDVIAGWQEGLQLIGAGGKIKLLIPSALGYGGVSKPGIPMNSVTIFDVELVSFTN
jgi:FKBP-type peptidyl-prolyl cis-trans isomerase FkpA